ncbi:universal stress protein [Caulobacter sp.]|uniref:universal stress protein n=1 Tax=Caulobacter sp. TaxID=78 RepID=UPI001B049650|nr:universal stress protein [Caulobacter sp.]MBO9543108.1 universal stress protein [Caulobacter sp.]
MYQKIVLAFDGSHEARSALREGALLALRCEARVWLLCVLGDNAAVAMAEGVQPGAAEQIAAASQQLVDEGVGKLKSVGLNATGHVVRGDPSSVISNFVREVGADLVVLGHRRRSFLERWWSGKSGGYIIDNVDCSLLVAQQPVSDAEFAAEMALHAVQAPS